MVCDSWHCLWTTIFVSGVISGGAQVPRVDPEGGAGYSLEFFDLNYIDEMGTNAEAEKELRRFIKDIWKSSDSASRVCDLETLGHLCLAQGKYGKAEAAYMQAMTILEKDRKARPGVDETGLLGGLAACYLKQGRLRQAEDLARQALSARVRAYGLKSPYTATELNNLAKAYFLQGRYSEAEPLWRRALAIEGPGTAPRSKAKLLEDYATLLRKTGRAAEADAQETRALAIRLRHAESRVRHLEADTKGIQQRSRDAIKSIAEHPRVYPDGVASALVNVEKEAPAEHARRLARALENHARLLRRAGRNDESARQEARAKAIRASGGG